MGGRWLIQEANRLSAQAPRHRRTCAPRRPVRASESGQIAADDLGHHVAERQAERPGQARCVRRPGRSLTASRPPVVVVMVVMTHVHKCTLTTAQSSAAEICTGQITGETGRGIRSADVGLLGFHLLGGDELVGQLLPAGSRHRADAFLLGHLIVDQRFQRLGAVGQNVEVHLRIGGDGSPRWPSRATCTYFSQPRIEALHHLFHHLGAFREFVRRW